MLANISISWRDDNLVTSGAPPLIWLVSMNLHSSAAPKDYNSVGRDHSLSNTETPQMAQKLVVF